MEKVKLNIVPKGKKSTCYASQNDNGRVVRFELFNELIPYILDGSETISIKVVRPDSEEILASIINTFEGKAYIDVVFNANMTAITGVGECEITITDGETVLGSRNFDINIEVDAYNGRDVIIETSTGTLAEFDTEVEDNALEYESEIPYNANGYTGLRVVNTRTAPVYDKTPYLFRKTPSGYGNSCIEKLNGLSVAFNQLSPIPETPQGVTGLVTDNRDGTWTFNGTAPGTNYIWIYNRDAIPSVIKPNHCYFCVSSFKEGLYQKARLQFILYGDSESFVDTEDMSKIFKTPSDFTPYNSFGFVIQYINGSVFTNDVLTPQLIDLTQMFGSTIADYIYSLERNQDGAGVAYFKQLFGADYYEYNAGELMSVKTSGRKTIGFNQFDIDNADLDNGNFDIRDPAREFNVTSYEYTRVLPSTAYCWKNDIASVAGRYIRFYDLNKNYIDEISLYGVGNKLFNTPDNAAYCRFMWYRAQPITVNEVLSSQVCINISDPSRDGEYEPYNAVTYPLDPDLELRGIPKLDANNNLYADGDTYESNGDVTRRYYIVDLGSFGWNRTETAAGADYPYRWIASGLNNAGGEITEINCISSKYTGVEYNNPNGFGILQGNINKAMSTEKRGYINVVDNSLDNLTPAQVKEALSGIYLLYILATPTSESADPYTDPQEARITEEFIDNRAIPIPVGQDSIYGTDIEYQDIDFNTTIYGGEIDAVNGVLSSEYNSDGSVKPTPEIIDIAPTPIPVRAGDNKIFNNANGNQTIRYYNQVEE